MYISREKCTGCGKCIMYCPVSAIVRKKDESKKGSYVEIIRDECVECSVCYRAAVCPKDAIVYEELEWPRVLRREFSDPFHEHRGTNVPGRGTEEMKTNDVTGFFPEGSVGIGLEFGRPGVGVRLKETETAIKQFVARGYTFACHNPLTQVIADEKTGALREDVKNEKVLSAIVEFVAPLEKTVQILEDIKEISSKVDTVFSLDIICKVSRDGSIPVLQEAAKAGFELRPNGKVNLGFGRR